MYAALLEHIHLPRVLIQHGVEGKLLVLLLGQRENQTGCAFASDHAFVLAVALVVLHGAATYSHLDAFAAFQFGVFRVLSVAGA